jgi:hypothetical protein
VGFWRRVGGSAVFGAAFFFYFFLFFVVVKTAFLVMLNFYTPSVFLPILTTFCQILPEISSKFTFVGQFTPSVFLLILALFC